MPVVKEYPSQSELKSLLAYSPETGEFVWKHNRNPKVKADGLAGCNTSSGRYIRIGNKNFAAHRLAYLYMEGCLPSEGYNIDHINGNNLDNRYCNLRSATFSQNSCNRRAQSNNKLGFKNVCFHSGFGKWRVNVTAKGVGSYQGFFKDLELALLVADEARRLYHRNYVRS